ncbi:MAG: phosphoethanolamine--lipid A transferase [Gammaproteobacteria bacterium]|nr:phosphoethanolamine--lipid A transferase [Gammaproteobacteria bacterium]
MVRLKWLAGWVTPNQRFVLLVSVFIMITGNIAFLERVAGLYPLEQGNWAFLLSLFCLFTAATAFVLNFLAYRNFTAPVLVLFLIISSATAYFMDNFGTVMNDEMLINMLQTNVSEAGDLLSVGMVFRLAFFGVVPAIVLLRFRPRTLGHAAEIRGVFFTAFLLLVFMAACLAPFTSNYASFFRAHKSVRYYANPTYVTYSAVSLVGSIFKDQGEKVFYPVATDAKSVEMLGNAEHRELIVLVVGETARADRFSLNGYSRPTNPNLEKEEVVSLKNVSSCGTSTAVSVPCMFSSLTEAGFSIEKAGTLENSLDVLRKNGVEVLWRDNNSDSKGVALRVDYEDFRNSAKNLVCDEECRDVGMLHGLQNYIDSRPGKDILIVLHQMGNHGPAYYKRYPQEFEYFKPVCKTSELSQCTQQEIDNAYDNAIRYTDYFLGQVIDLLKRYDKSHETAMLYVSDHGESLGEFGLYLHGAPKAFAPKVQTHVASVVWFGQSFDYKLKAILPYANIELTHDALFCTLLLAYELDTATCMQSRKIIEQSHNDAIVSIRE